MFCPSCGQEQLSDEIRYCSRCGFPMTGVADLIANRGASNQPARSKANASSPRKKGLKLGGTMFLLGIFVVPFLAVLSKIFFFPKQFIALAAIVFFLGGFLRMVYAQMFESGEPDALQPGQSGYGALQKLTHNNPQAAALPPPQSIPASDYAPPDLGNWRETGDLVPSSVTDSTTKLLDKTVNK